MQTNILRTSCVYRAIPDLGWEKQRQSTPILSMAIGIFVESLINGVFGVF